MDLQRIFSKRVSRWTILQIDMAICLFSIVFSFLLRFNFNIPPHAWEYFPYTVTSTLLVKLLFFYRFKPYAGVIRYTSIEDAKKIFYSISYSFLILITLQILAYLFFNHSITPFSILLIDYFISIFLMASFRILAKIAFYEYRQQFGKKINIAIYGATEIGMIAKKTLSQYSGSIYNVVAFFDENPANQKSMIDGIQIYPFNQLNELVKEKNIEQIIISNALLPSKKKQEIVDTCLNHGIKVRTIPPVEKWINGELSINQIKEIRIEDILGRPTIEIINDEVVKQYEHLTILITGAAGSIGSEISRQLANLNPSLLILLDNNETALHELSLEMDEMMLKVNYIAILADITNEIRLKKIFDKYRPDIVFHAAAYKHVPMMENNPTEALNVNIRGTKTVADLSVEYDVKKFVFISTDKAVNPTNVMGASKRIAEIYVQSLNNYLEKANIKITRFITTRFGNVLGSNGSVIPRFKKQIAEGGPITITHPEITRYFMTIPEAVQLVLDAGAMGKGGEIFVFDMGESVKIVDLAKKMVKLSGLTLGKDIQLIFTGLRPGEKLYEELLNDKESTLPTHHPKIMKAKVIEYDYEIIEKEIQELISLYNLQNNELIINKMKKLVPEYLSRNSIYEKLDYPK
jgi:FlaA1/EpsC-like NDP-sugar epimerase